ncbi:hypothetical protein KJ673_02715 [Patescibacteria group bacterium]|nr:hypothetical protein [Patescibacteria group bacterium]MBU4452971.1 hypothetical protein [Patescibacteria group bacterium]MCG2687704.1 hypothetical protein [Candidatus Parcubacteria bacterium]
MEKNNKKRPNSLTNAPLQYAPQNEIGVVYLFAHIARKKQFRIEKIRPQFPDCIAYRRSGDQEKLVRIEFEYRSSSFKAHHHDTKKCDCIVCWHHDWPDCPLEVIELKKSFHSVPKVWIQPVIKSQWHNLDLKHLDWGLSKRATIGDILLMYRCYPDKAIRDIFIITGELSRGVASWRNGSCYSAAVKRLCKLTAPLFLEDFKTHRVLKTAGFVRRNFQGNLLVSEYWAYIHELITKRNPKTLKILKKYDPEKM